MFGYIEPLQVILVYFLVYTRVRFYFYVHRRVVAPAASFSNELRVDFTLFISFPFARNPRVFHFRVYIVDEESSSSSPGWKRTRMELQLL